MMKESVRNSSQRGSTEQGLGCLFVIVLVVGVLIWGVQAIFWGEREGTVKYDDCREVVTLEPESPRTLFKSFTCSYTKTKSGRVIRGLCVHVDNDSTMFSASHTCATAFVYEKGNEGCTDSRFPYLHYDDRCYSQPQ